MWQRLRVWLRSVLRPGAMLRDVHDELQSHFEREVERNVARGASADDARRAAQRAFGNIAAHREDARDAAGTGMVEHVAQDVRYAVRTLRRRPGYAIVVVASVALGIGANVAIFSVADTRLLRPLAVREPERLVTIEQTLPDGFRQPNFAFSDYERFRENRRVFAGVTATTWADGFNIGTSGPGGRHCPCSTWTPSRSNSMVSCFGSA